MRNTSSVGYGIGGVLFLAVLALSACHSSENLNQSDEMDASVDGASQDAARDAAVTDTGVVDADAGGAWDGDIPDATTDGGTDDGGVDGGGVSFCTDGWCWQRPRLFGADLYAVWGSSPSEAWAVGAAGSIVYFDGVRWRLARSGVLADLFGIWGTSREDIWAVGDHGTIIHFDGNTWSRVASPTTQPLRSVHGTAPDDVYAVGDQDARIHFDGVNWSILPTLFPDTQDKPNQYAVWSFPNGEAWSVGDAWGYAVLHRTSAGVWETTDVDIGSYDTTFFAVWGSSPTDVWMTSNFTGYYDYIQHWDGASWQPVIPSGDVNFWGTRGIAGSGPDDVWFFGTWQGSGHFNGTTFVPVPDLEDKYLTAGWIDPSGFGWTVGQAGLIGQHQGQGTGWTFVSGGDPYDSLAQVHVGGSDDAWAVGRLSLVHWDGTQWADVEPASGSPEFTGVWAAAPDDVWIVGWGDSSVNVQHWDGTTWHAVPHPLDDSLRAIWGSASNDIWISSAGGASLHWDGTLWEEVTNGPGEAYSLQGTARDDIWGIGGNGTIRHFDGTTWTTVPSGTTQELFALHVFSRTDAWAGGSGPTLLHWDGTSWSPAQSIPNIQPDRLGRRTITGIAGFGSNDLWICTFSGEIFHFDGSTWIRSTKLPVALSFIAQFPSGTLVAVGDNGSIVQH